MPPPGTSGSDQSNQSGTIAHSGEELTQKAWNEATDPAGIVHDDGSIASDAFSGAEIVTSVDARRSSGEDPGDAAPARMSPQSAATARAGPVGAPRVTARGTGGRYFG